MSYLDRKNILTESEIDNILRLLRKGGKGKDADKIQNSKKLQKDILKLQKQIDVVNKTKKDYDRITGRKHKPQTILDYI